MVSPLIFTSRSLPSSSFLGLVRKNVLKKIGKDNMPMITRYMARNKFRSVRNHKCYE